VAEVVLTRWADARDALRHRDLRQALYDEGRDLMGTVIVNLHGPEHRDRRRLERRLFTPATDAHYETVVIPPILDSVLAPAVAAGRGELGDLARRVMLRFAAAVAGVDVTDADFAEFHDLMSRLSRASVVVHAAADPEAKAGIVEDGREALAHFDRRFFQPSLTRRLAEPAADMLSLLAPAGLPPDVLLREIAYYPWVGTHSTSVALVWAMHHLFSWAGPRPDPADRSGLQRFVHESLRLHPASPVAVRRALAPLVLRSGVTIASGDVVRIDMVAANRDPAVFGAHPEAFDPARTIEPEAGPWGLSFGSGFHACLGADLAGGVGEAETGAGHHGSLVAMAAALLQRGAHPDPADPPTLDTSTVRHQWGRYPVRFEPGAYGQPA
jgi:cytochrome P450